MKIKIKKLEELWDEIGLTPTEEIFKGYIIAHFEQIYLGLRDTIAVNINIFDDSAEGMRFVEKCCKSYKCKIVHIDQGEIWVTNKEDFNEVIPSRFSDNPDDHRRRGKLLGYPMIVIENYFK